MGYGREVSRDHDVLGELDLAPAGNLVIRAGHQNRDGSWTQSIYVVLSPDEHDDLIDELVALRERRASR